MVMAFDRLPRGVALALLIGVAAGCGGDSGTDPYGNGGGLTLAKPTGNGDGQLGAPGSVLPSPIRVILRQNGSPKSGTTITWEAVGGGQVNPSTSSTGSDGIASTTVTLPGTSGNYQFRGSVAGASGSPQTFTLIATTGSIDHVDVQVVNSDFVPSTFSLGAGGTVTYTWASGASSHNVTPVAPNLIPASSNPAPPGTHDAPYNFIVTFPNAGTFKFFCGVHGAPDAGMHGTVTVIP